MGNGSRRAGRKSQISQRAKGSGGIPRGMGEIRVNGEEHGGKGKLCRSGGREGAARRSRPEEGACSGFTSRDGGWEGAGMRTRQQVAWKREHKWGAGSHNLSTIAGYSRGIARGEQDGRERGRGCEVR